MRQDRAAGSSELKNLVKTGDLQRQTDKEERLEKSHGETPPLESMKGQHCQ